MRHMILRIASMTVALLASLVALVVQNAQMKPSLAQTQERPNILFVMTDDQPIQDTIKAMPQLRERVRDRGMSLPNTYVSESLCCPSRASVLRGQYPHNTGVVRNGPPNGGVQTFRESGDENDALPIWLGQQGYVTALVGKYMNGYNASYKPPGWNLWFAKADGNTSGEKVNKNGHVIDFEGKPGNWGDRYRKAALAYLDRTTDQATDRPFAMFFWTSQPHLEANVYANRYANLYSDATLPSKPSFNEQDRSDKPKWVQNLGRIDRQEKTQLRQWRRNQLRSVRQVDDTVGAMLDLLSKRGELENTYIVFTSDNSTHMGEHRWFGHHGAKATPYEEAANVPMYVRGPGITPGSTSDKLVLNNDIAPTFVNIAGGSLPAYVDGRNLLPLWTDTATDWRTAIMNERPLDDSQPIPPYHAIITQQYTYVEYDNTIGEKELYNRASDPYELASKHADPTYDDTMAALSLQLHAIKGCKADVCRTAENSP